MAKQRSAEMEQFREKEVLQAILIADDVANNFRPISNNLSTALLPLANVPLLDYALEALNRNGVEEVYIYSSLFVDDVKQHINERIKQNCSWSIKMSVRVIGSEDCRCLGDALRDLDATTMMRSHFILISASTVTNANLAPILEQHKKTARFDRGAAMTVVFKECTTQLKTGDEVMVAFDPETKRLYFHQRIKQTVKETHFKIPLEVFLDNSQISLHHNLIDPQIAIGSPAALSLFSDNFDFENRDDFIRGLLINEEILESRIYVSLLPAEQYARKVTNWPSYQIVSNEVINRWAYPLVPDMEICSLKQNYLFLRNNIYRHHTANSARSVLKENVIISEQSSIGNDSSVTSSVVGKFCKVGEKCILNNAFLFDNVIVEDGCEIQHCVIGKGCRIGANTVLLEGVVLGSNVILPQNSKLQKVLIISSNTEEEEVKEKLGEAAFVIDDTEAICASDSEDEELEPDKIAIAKMTKLLPTCEDSDYNSSSEEEESHIGSPIPDDTNIFLSEVVDSLVRGFQNKSDPDFLILEINSSRYAYNMALKEVNFYVVKAIFSLPSVRQECGNVLTRIHEALSHLGPVVTNYIKTEDAMLDCLKAVEESCSEEPDLKSKAAQIVHYLYDKEYVSEDAILAWYNELDDELDWLKSSLKKLVDWLMASSEEESEEEE